MTLPNLQSTEEAIEYGRHMTSDQYLMCDGARQALQRAFNAMPSGNYDVLQIKSNMARDIQLYREAMESVPFGTLAVLSERRNKYEPMGQD